MLGILIVELEVVNLCYNLALVSTIITLCTMFRLHQIIFKINQYAPQKTIILFCDVFRFI